MIVLSFYRKLFTAIFWLIFVSILFCLPGSALPSNDWMTRIWFDKWVHIGIFTGILFLWSRAFQLTNRISLLLVVMIALAYGLLVEVIQGRFIANRSFDWTDLLADFIGCIIGLRFWLRYKKKPL